MKTIDPKKYNLSSRVILKESSNEQIFLIINRKSRIIMKDGNRILDIIQKIKTIEKDKKTLVLTSAPVCSKTRQFLNKNKVEIQKLI
tara:strand:- start:1552 stop:1812 length:261 start_codon:yes stop_codon:yes gene_type:complete